MPIDISINEIFRLRDRLCGLEVLTVETVSACCDFFVAEIVDSEFPSEEDFDAYEGD